MCCACQVGTLGCAALVGLRASDLSSSLWAASCCTVVGNRNFVLLVVFNLMIDQRNSIMVHLSIFILVVLQARNHSRVVIWSGAGCA